ncbi:MAG TPA: O-antigen ligase family protein [Phycisphaerales bacterium]|nr:O-antigen ligase family protein [Phycisphaerales bacterium]HMP38093.1 O-antigen ligase family protein [Phycisphaerales bacterium]
MAPVVALILACSAAFLLWRPQYAAVAILVMFPLEQLVQSYFMVAQAQPYLVNVAVALLAALAVVLRAAKGEKPWEGFGNPLIVLIWVLYAYCWISMLWSPSMGPALGMLRPGLPYWILLMLLAPMLFGDIASIRPVLVALLAVGGGVAALILLSPNASFYAGRLTIEFSPFFRDARSNPLALAQMGGMMAVVAMLLVGRGPNPLFLALRVAALIIGLGLGISSGSRGQVIFAVAAGFMFLPVARRIGSVRHFAAFAIGAAVFYFAVTATFRQFIGAANETRWQLDNLRDGIETRTEAATTLLSAWLQSPVAWLIGLGSNAYNHYSDGGNYVHNMIVEVLCEQGLIGMSLLLAIVWLGFKATRKLVARHREDPAMRSTVAAMGGLALYGLLLALKEGSLLGHPYAVFMLAILAKSWAIEERAPDEFAEEEHDGEHEGEHDGEHGGFGDHAFDGPPPEGRRSGAGRDVELPEPVNV